MSTKFDEINIYYYIIICRVDWVSNADAKRCYKSSLSEDLRTSLGKVVAILRIPSPLTGELLGAAKEQN